MSINYVTTATGIHVPTSANTGTDFALGVKQMADELTAAIPAARLIQQADSSISTASWTSIVFGGGSTVRDSTSMHSEVTNPSRITFAKAGWYSIEFGVAFEANATGTRVARIYGTGTTPLAINEDNDPSSTAATSMTVNTIRYFAAADYIQGQVYQDSGGPLNVVYIDEQSPVLAAAYLGA